MQKKVKKMYSTLFSVFMALKLSGWAAVCRLVKATSEEEVDLMALQNVEGTAIEFKEEVMGYSMGVFEYIMFIVKILLIVMFLVIFVYVLSIVIRKSFDRLFKK